MHIKTIFISAALALTSAQIAYAQPSINDMSGCQAILQFVDVKLTSISKADKNKYSKADIKAVKKGLNLYNKFIQDEHITPGLMAFNGNDAAKAKAMQPQITTYQNTLIQAHKAKYPQARLFTDHAVAIDNCYKKAPMGDAEAQTLKTALETMVAMAMKK